MINNPIRKRRERTNTQKSLGQFKVRNIIPPLGTMPGTRATKRNNKQNNKTNNYSTTAANTTATVNTATVNTATSNTATSNSATSNTAANTLAANTAAANTLAANTPAANTTATVNTAPQSIIQKQNIKLPPDELLLQILDVMLQIIKNMHTGKKLVLTDNRASSIIKTKTEDRIRPLHIEEPPSGYFKYDHVFLLNGHGSDVEYELRYKLKNNEFYANSTTCGRLGISSEAHHSERLNRFFSSSSIKIPKPNNSSYYSSNSNNIFSIDTTSKWNSKNNDKTITEKDAYKIYVPFSKSILTQTIPITIYQYLSLHLANKWQATKNYSIVPIMFSGIINKQKFPKDINYIYNKSDTCRIGRAFTQMFWYIFGNRPVPENHVKFYLIFDEDSLYDRYYSNKPIHIYNRQIIKEVSQFSFISLEEIILYNLNKNFQPSPALPYLYNKRTIQNSNITWNDIINELSIIPIPELYNLLREKLNDDDPIFIINPLCRGIPNIPSVDRNTIVPRLKRDLSSLFTSKRSLKGKETQRYAISKEPFQLALQSVTANNIQPVKETLFSSLFTRKKTRNEKRKAYNEQRKRQIMNKQYKMMYNRIHGDETGEKLHINQIKQIFNLENEEQIADWERYLESSSEPRRPIIPPLKSQNNLQL